MRRLIKSCGLELVVFLLFILSWVLMGIAGWLDYSAWKAALGQKSVVFGFDGYICSFARDSFRIWQGDFFLLICVLLLVRHITGSFNKSQHDSVADLTRKLDSAMNTQQEMLRSMRDMNDMIRRDIDGETKT